ncbi:MAG: outer membrane protein assembly factor BamD [Chthoniobacterales bacterium]
MRSRFPIVISLLAALAALPSLAPAAVIFKPGEKAKYLAPGEEEINGTAQELFATAQSAENRGNDVRAIKAYRAIVKKYPRDTLAAGAVYRMAVLLEKNHDYLRAADAYRVTVEKFPRSPNFEESIEAQFRIGEMYLAGKKLKLLGIPVKSAIDKAVTIFAGIVRSAPYGKYTARAQFNIGRASEKQGNATLAVAAYQSVIEKFPNDPIAADAQYQIGYIWFKEGRSGVRDAKAAANAKLGFQDFLYRYPKSEKVAQARENLKFLDQKQTTDSFQIAKFYDKQKDYRAAVIYYNDVIRQQPGSDVSQRAKKRVDELRAKVGEAALQSAALTAETAKKPGKTVASEGERSSSGSSNGSPGMRTSPSDVGPLPPLPPPDLDESLPPPASLNPDTTTAPYVPSSSETPAPDATPESTPEP